MLPRVHRNNSNNYLGVTTHPIKLRCFEPAAEHFHVGEPAKHV